MQGQGVVLGAENVNEGRQARASLEPARRTFLFLLARSGLLILVLLAHTDNLKTCLDPIHDPPNRSGVSESDTLFWIIWSRLAQAAAWPGLYARFEVEREER
jgi:hypothetical protein